METLRSIVDAVLGKRDGDGKDNRRDDNGKRSRDLEEQKPEKKQKYENSFLVDNQQINKILKLDLVKTPYKNNVVRTVNILLKLFDIKAMKTPEIVKAFGVENETDILKKTVKALKGGLRKVLKGSEKGYTIMEKTPNKIEFLGNDEGIYVLFVVLKFDRKNENKLLKKDINGGDVVADMAD